jgi:hypothetical protein
MLQLATVDFQGFPATLGESMRHGCDMEEGKMTLPEAITQLVLPPILGGVAGLFTPWFAWYVEKRRTQFNRRQQVIDAWRREFHEYFSRAGDPGDRGFLHSAAYSGLRPFLSASRRNHYENLRTVHVDGNFEHDLLDDIHRIERAWGLI